MHFCRGAAIPDRPVSSESLEEEPADLPEAARGLEKSMSALFDGNALLDEQDMPELSGMDDIYAALEDMARAEINLYQTKDK